MNRMTVIIGLVIVAAILVLSLSKQDKSKQSESAPPCVAPAGEKIPQASAAPAPPCAGYALDVVALYPPDKQIPGNEVIIYFNEALAPFQQPEGTLDAALVTHPFVPGNVHLDDAFIRFSSADFSTVFDDPQVTCLEIILHENLRSVSNQALAPEKQHITFDAPAPSITSVHLENITEEHALVQVAFSRVADLSALPELLVITDPQGRTIQNVSVAPNDNNLGALLTIPLAIDLPVIISVAAGVRWGQNNQQVAGKMSTVYPATRTLRPLESQFVRGAAPYIEILFNHGIPVQWLNTLAVVRDATTLKPIPFTIAHDVSLLSRSRRVRLSLEVSPETVAMEEAKMEISPWLRSNDENKAYHLSERLDMVVRPSAPSDTVESRSASGQFGLNYHYWETSVADGLMLQTNLSHTINPADFLEHVEMIPPVELNAEEGSGWSRGLRLKGNFKSETKYTMRVTAGLTNSNGEVILRTDSSFEIEETPLQAGAAFDMTNLYYFPRRDMTPPGLQARNITEAKVMLAQVFPSNLPVFVRDFSRSGANTRLLTEYAREVGEIAVTFPKIPDTLLTSKVDLNTLLPGEQRGVFIMTVDPAYDYQDNCRLLIYTDIGALTHWTDKELVLFAHNLFTLAPIPQAKVTVYSNKFQPIGTTYTNVDGIARFMSFEGAFGTPALAIIEANNDYTFVDLLKQMETKDAFTASMPNFDAEGYDAYIYLDRNLYRPGETVHIRWIVRTRYVDAVTDVPFQLRIANPQGQWIYETSVTPNEFGTGSFSFKTEQTHPTGKYRVELRVPEAPLSTGETTFNLEEFVPNRMRAEASYDCERLVSDQTTTIQVKAENLFGGPAAGRKSEARIYLRPTVYASDAWPGYHFGNEDPLEDQLIQLGEAVTDENGLASFSYTFAPPPEATMPLEAVVGGRVFEVGGRAVSDTDSVTAFPFDVLLGISVAPRDDAEMLDVHVAAIRNNDTPADLTSVQITLDREEWNYHVRGFWHNRETRWEKEFRPIKTLDVALSEGKGSIQLPYPDYGTYRLRVHAPDTRMHSTLHFNRWWRSLNVTSSARPELISLSVDKELYRVGDEVNLRIESPYDGNAFVVVQGETIHEQVIVPVKGGEGKATFVVPHHWFPNAWIQATVVRDTSQQEGTQYPYSSYAMLNVPLDAPDRHITVSLQDVPEEIRPAEPYTLRVTTHDAGGAPVAAEVTVAAVDEGIHGILGYDNPDPYPWFQRSRQFGLRRTHYYENVFFDGTPSPIGGDMMRRLGIASQVGDNWIRPVALWSGAVTTDASGQAEITFDVPEFVGQLRLVAVAVTSRATGATADSVYVRRPYIMRTGMPRFALPGDRFECTASAVNTTDAPVTALLRWNASGTLSGTGEKQLELSPRGEAFWRVPFTAGATPGQGTIEWTMTFTDSAGATLETLTENAPIPVGSPAAYQTETELITLAPGETRVIENTRFINEPALHTTLHVAGTPLWRLYPGLRYLLRYPHGCVEQVTSQAMPLYLLRNYAQVYKDLLPAEQTVDATVVDTYIRHATERLLMMQTSDGGLSTWAGGTYSYPYGSVYALHFLTLMRRDRAYEGYESAFRSLQQYVLGVMRDERRYSKAPSDYYLRAYACYVLALDGNLEAIEYVPRFDHVAIPRSGRYLLAAAKAMHSQDAGDIEAYIESSPNAEFNGMEYSGTLHSEARADAIRLIALIQMNAPPDKMLPLVESLFHHFEGQRYYSTQETSFLVTSLGMYIEKFHKGDPGSITASIIAPDGEHALSGNELFKQVLTGQSPRFEIRNTGNLPIFINVEMSGLPLQPRTTPIAEGFTVNRDYFLETGKPVEGNTFAHGGQYIVTLTVTPSRRLENLLLVDLLPAGFEIANPRLEPEIQPADGESQEKDSVNKIFSPSHLEVRDDRIALAVDELEANKKYTFRYLVRAVTPGTFQLPALHAECMYYPTTRAATVTGEIVVE